MARILIVDDSIVARLAVKSCVKGAGHELFEASSGHGALEMFGSVKPHVTFLDITMPDKNGIDVLREIRIDHPQAVVIMLSADIQKQTRESAHALGAFAVLGKPPVKGVVQAELARALAEFGDHDDQP